MRLSGSRLLRTRASHVRQISVRRLVHSTDGLDGSRALGLPSNSTPLQKILYASIQAKGPIPVSEYMQMCLSHPIEGYYMKGDPIGARGDFITSPEISQLFGELVGIWFVYQWLEHGQSRAIRVVELGPGRGTLMDDMLRTFDSIKQTRGQIQAVHLVETSNKLREEQKSRLTMRVPERILCWHDRAEDISKSDDAFTVLVAHELFDAIPIHIIEKTPDGFQEVLVDIDRTAQTTTTGTLSSVNAPCGFRFVLSGRLSPLAHTLGQSSPRFASVPNASRIEVSPTSWGIARTIGEMLSAPGGGAGLIIDYGDNRAFGSSFRASNTNPIDVFYQPGLSDLTANVDFAYLEEAIASTSASTRGPITQRAFLAGMGVSVRVQRLLAGVEDAEKRTRIEKGAQRLMDPLGMGTQYKVLGITSSTGDTYPFNINIT
ncbi:NADH dehydrogenase [ubiquinone] complex I, assembly factor 7 [Ceratobasidium theobromae]|uniref:Protein arginine methyltransferase NDUFAF7 n=1 Tax=Ceratobasidium theobromae TaxID=1582974 RepID=A0A5N5QYB0_9AGAM|nr:NADH dehydrogenase [ubiquinone] complex I, assembly factor 7 [Ceratobasidium theobromae]